MRKIRISNDIAYTELDGHLVMLKISSGIYYSLNEVGTQIVRSLRNGMDQQSIAAEIARASDISMEEWEDDIETFVDTLLQASIFEEYPP